MKASDSSPGPAADDSTDGGARKEQATPREGAMRAVGGLFTGWPMAVLLLAIHYGLAVTAVCTKSNTYDEIVHITGGYTYWKLNDYRLNPEGDVLAQRLMALPLLLGDYKLPPHDDTATARSDDSSGDWRNCDLWSFGYRFFYESGNDPQMMLRLSRSFMALLSVALGVLVYFWSRNLFGPAGGMLSLALYAFCPPLLANGALATMDLAAALCFLAAVGAFWRMLHRLSVGTLLVSSLALAALFLVKFSAVLAVPMLVVLLLVRMFRPHPLELHLGGIRPIRGPLRRSGVLLAAAIVHVLVVWGAIWIAYGARYEASPGVQADRADFYTATRKFFSDPKPDRIGQTVRYVRDHRLLPEAYICGFVIIYDSTQGHSAFMNGQYSYAGWRSFFPYCLAVKTPLPLLAFVLLAAIAALARWGGLAALYRTWPLWVLIGIYMASSIASHLNIGYRHVLPVWAAAIVLCGAAAAWFSSRFRLAKLVPATLLVLLAAEAAWTWPNYLSYFNPLAGGTQNGYRRLVDSSTDWGQDLPALKRWLDANTRPGEPVYLSYFGIAKVSSYGIDNVQRLPSFRNQDLPERRVPTYRPGVYCVSATMLQGAIEPKAGPWIESWERQYQFYLREFGKLAAAKNITHQQYVQLAVTRNGWTKDLLDYDHLQYRRLTVYLRHRTPDANVGGSILVYRLGQKELDEAFTGSPAELAADKSNPFVK